MQLNDEQREMSRRMLPGAAVLVALVLMICAFYLGTYMSMPPAVQVPDYTSTFVEQENEISELKDSITRQKEGYDELHSKYTRLQNERIRRGSVVSDRVRAVGVSLSDSSALSRYLQVAARNGDRPLHETPAEFLFESGAFTDTER